MSAWLPISYPANNETGHISYQLETAQLPFGVRIRPWELHRGAVNQLPNGNEYFYDENPFHRKILLRDLY